MSKNNEILESTPPIIEAFGKLPLDKRIHFLSCIMNEDPDLRDRIARSLGSNAN